MKDDDLHHEFAPDLNDSGTGNAFKEGLVAIYSHEPDISWTINENWDSTVQEDILLYLRRATGNNILAMRSLLGHSCSFWQENGRFEFGEWQGVWEWKASPGINPRARMTFATFPRRTRRESSFFQMRKVRIETHGQRFTFLRDTIREKTWNRLFEPVHEGLAHFFLKHTTSNLVLLPLTELPTVMDDFDHLVPTDVNSPSNTFDFLHTYDNPADIAAHIRTAMLGPPHLTLPIRRGKLVLDEDTMVVVMEFCKGAPRARFLVLVVEGSAVEEGCEVEHESDLDGDEAMWGLNWDQAMLGGGMMPQDSMLGDY